MMNNPDLPEAFSQVFGMGQLMHIHRAKKSSRTGSAITAGVCLVLAPVILLGGLLYSFNRVEQYGQVVFWETFVIFLIGAGILGLIGLLTAWSAFSNWNKALVIYQNGFAYNDRSGLRNWNWEDLDSITSAVTRHYTNGVYTGTTHIYTLLKRGTGERMVLTDTIEKVEEAANFLRGGAYPILFKKYADAYNSGSPVRFGPVTLSRSEGITIGKKNYPWDQVKQVSINQGVIAVAKKDGGWFSGASVAASSVPNLELMLSIMDNVVGLKTK